MVYFFWILFHLTILMPSDYFWQLDLLCIWGNAAYARYVSAALAGTGRETETEIERLRRGNPRTMRGMLDYVTLLSSLSSLHFPRLSSCFTLRLVSFCSVVSYLIPCEHYKGYIGYINSRLWDTLHLFKWEYSLTGYLTVCASAFLKTVHRVSGSRACLPFSIFVVTCSFFFGFGNVDQNVTLKSKHKSHS